MFRREQPAKRGDEIRETLFGDASIEAWPPAPTADEPWASFVRARDAVQAGHRSEAIIVLQGIASTTGIGTRHVLQAWHFLRQLGETPPADLGRTVLGVVVEVDMESGLDILACYADRSARYYNFSGAGVVWERPDASMDGPIGDLLSAGQLVADQIGPWLGLRPPAPVQGHARLNMLTPSGLFFGEAPLNALAADPLGGPLLQAANVLLQELTRLTERS